MNNNRPENDAPNYPSDAGGLLRFLYERVDAREMTDAELEWISRSSHTIELTALNLSKTIGGVAALIAIETDRDRASMKSGAFQPFGLPEFLYGMADVAETINEIAAICSDAEFSLRERWRARALACGYKEKDHV